MVESIVDLLKLSIEAADYTMIPPREDAKIKQHGNANGITVARDNIVRIRA
jgi:hypothetical protein